MPSANESLKAYAKAVQDSFEDEVMDDVKFVAKEMFVRHHSGQDPNALVPWHNRDYPYLNTGLNHHKMADEYIPAWATYIDLAQSAIDAKRLFDAKNR